MPTNRPPDSPTAVPGTSGAAGAKADRRTTRNLILVWAGLLTLYFVWGSTYLGIRVAVETIPPFLMGAVRFVLAGAALAVASVALDRSSVRWPTAREWLDVTIVGGFLLLGGMGLVAWGEQTVPAGITALLIGLMPMWVAIVSWIAYRERQPRIVLLGIVVGFVGVGILAAPRSGGGSIEPLALAALIGSPISWALGSVYSARHPRSVAPSLLGTGLEMIAGGLLLAVAGALTGELGRVRAPSLDSIAALAYLVLVGSLIGYTTYAWLLRNAPLPLISTYAYVNPIVAVVLGAALLAEPIEPRTVVAGAIIVAAVALIITARGRMAANDERSPALEVPADPRDALPRSRPRPADAEPTT